VNGIVIVTAHVVRIQVVWDVLFCHCFSGSNFIFKGSGVQEDSRTLWIIRKH